MRKDEIEPVHVCFGDNHEFYRYEILFGEGDSNVTIYELPSGKANYPYHYHESHEEIFYIIRGEGIVETEEGDKRVRSGDVIVCPPNPSGAHRIINTSEEERLVYIEFDTVSYPEVAHYPRTKTLGVLYEDMKRNQFFKEDSSVDYEYEVLDEDL
ncbi:MAG: cupin domain-containing protein [Candidatus Saliniplasma sp.]